MDASRLLAVVLRSVGGVCLLAVVGLLMPRDWMAAIHEAAGLGPFPTAAITEYLARSTSALCTFYGGLLLLAARDVPRYRVLIAYQAVGIMVCSLVGGFMGFGLGRLWWFVLADAILCWGYGVPVLLLLKRIPVADSTE